MTDIKDGDFKAALQKVGGPNCKALLKDPKAYKATFDIIKAVAKKDAVAGAAAMGSGANAIAKATASNSATKDNFRAASMAMSTFKATTDLVKIASMTNPIRAVVVIGATGVQKTGLAISLIGGDSERAKCLGAVMELAGSATVTALTLPSAATGAGVFLIIVSAASTVSSSWNAYEACKDIVLPGGGSSSNAAAQPAATPPPSQPRMSPLG